MQRWLLITLLVIAVSLGTVYYSRTQINNWYIQTNTHLETAVNRIRTVEQKITAPPPLRGPAEEVDTDSPAETAKEIYNTSLDLTATGIIAETNFWRQQNGLPALSNNLQLTAAADMKVSEMFELQYFGHESPTGKNLDDLMNTAGYEYLAIGENLALGNYENDRALVEAWMDSLGHRENILNSRYTEIGVVVKRGVYEGQIVWIAVQEFGRPLSECPSPSVSLSAQIEENKNSLSELGQQISTKREEIDGAEPKSGPVYNQMVDEYNGLVSQYNSLIKETKALVSTYNAQVDAYNVCVR